MEVKMPDIYERLAQLKEILRHMFAIGQELNNEVLTLKGENAKLLNDNKKLQEQVEEQRGYLQTRDKINGEKQTLIDNLSTQLKGFEQSLAGLREARQKDDKLLRIIDDFELLRTEWQKYETEKAELEASKNSFEIELKEWKVEKEELSANLKFMVQKSKEDKDKIEQDNETIKKLKEEILFWRRKAGCISSSHVPENDPSQQMPKAGLGNAGMRAVANTATPPEQPTPGITGIPNKSLLDKRDQSGEQNLSTKTYGKVTNLSEDVKNPEDPVQPKRQGAGQGNKTKDF